MILGSITLICLALIVIVTLVKLWNIANGGNIYPEVVKYFGFALVFFAWLFILIVVNTQIKAAVTDATYEIELYEATQYLNFANFFLLAHVFALALEVLFGFKVMTGRGRLRVARDA